jgi:hypothetical protein
MAALFSSETIVTLNINVVTYQKNWEYSARHLSLSWATRIQSTSS